MRKQEIYGSIETKLNEWITYDENAPKVDYREDPKVHDAYRKTHDRDCVLTNGNLNADTIFSLWLPLRNTIVCLNDKQTIKEVGNIYDKMSFVRALVQDGNLEKLLPDNRLIVYKLGQLFKWGVTRANVMILPERWLNSARAKKPYYDYMPAFLLESFPGGAFASAWKDLEDFKDWVQREDLYMFFDGGIKLENIIDLAGTGDLKSSFPLDGAVGMERLIDRYIEILRERNTCLRMKRRRNSANLQEYYTSQEKNN